MVLSHKFDVVKQGLAKVNIDILEISELKWMGMGELNSDDHYIYYCVRGPAAEGTAPQRGPAPSLPGVPLGCSQDPRRAAGQWLSHWCSSPQGRRLSLGSCGCPVPPQ